MLTPSWLHPSSPRREALGLFLGVLALAALYGCGSPATIAERRAETNDQGSDLLVAGEEAVSVPEAAAEEVSAEPADEVAPDAEPDQGAAAGGPLLTPRETGAPATATTKKKSPRGADSALASGSGGGGASREDAVLDALRQTSQARTIEAKYYAEVGNGLYAQNDFTGARDAFQKALNLDPLLDDARKKLNNCLLMLGERSGEAGAIAPDLAERSRVARDQRRLEVDRNLALGDAAVKNVDATEDQLRDAETAVSHAIEVIQLDPDYDAAQRLRAENLHKEVAARIHSLEEAHKRDLMKLTDTEAQHEVERAAELKRNQVQVLLRKTSEFIRQEDYTKAMETSQRVLELDPENRVARFWLTDSKDQLLRERRARAVRERVENGRLTAEDFAKAASPQDTPFEFPAADEWQQSVKRARELEVTGLEDSEAVSAIKAALEAQIDVTFDQTPLEDVIQQLRTLTGARMLTDPEVDAKSMMVTGQYQGQKAKDVLDLVLETVGLIYVYRDNVLFVTNPGAKTANPPFVIYNVSDILNKVKDFVGPEMILRPSGDTGGSSSISFTSSTEEDDSQIDPDALVELVKKSTEGGETAWEEPNSIEFHAGQLLVTAPTHIQSQVQDVLANLRKDADLFVVIEARFIDVNDDFLEDVGVDSRSLGQVNNYGTPFGNVVNDARTGGQDLGFVKQGSPVRDVTLIMGQDRWAGRVQHIIDGFTGNIRGERLTGGQGIGGLTLQATWLEPFQLNVIVRAVQERADVRQLTAPIVTAHNGQRVYVSIITQRAYISDYNLVSGGTGFAIIEVADPEVATFQEGVILDVDPVISYDKKYVTLDVRPTLATLIGGVISTILISLGSFTNVAFQVPIGVPRISLQQSYTSVTVPNGGTVLLGGFKSLNEAKYSSYLPILGKIPIFANLFRRKAELAEKRSLVILLSARIVDLRGEEAQRFNIEG